MNETEIEELVQRLVEIPGGDVGDESFRRVIQKWAVEYRLYRLG